MVMSVEVRQAPQPPDVPEETTAVMNVDVAQVMERVEDDLAKAEAELAAAQGRVTELRSVRDGFKLAIERYAATSLPAAKPEPRRIRPEDAEALRAIRNEAAHAENSRISALRQMDAALWALQTIGRPASTREIYEFLAQAGRNDDYEQVRSATTYLRRRELIRRVTDNLWAPTDRAVQHELDLSAP
jgi:hypothetical protein